MKREIFVSTSFEKFEKIQKGWIKEVLLEVLESNPSTTDAKEDHFITRQEAAALLKISLPTLNKRTKDGNLVAYRIGTRVLYKRTEIIASLDKVEPLNYRRAQ